jgi:hypothetical protein
MYKNKVAVRTLTTIYAFIRVSQFRFMPVLAVVGLAVHVSFADQSGLLRQVYFA